MFPFKAGDSVVCLNSKNAKDPALKEGQEYMVEDVENNNTFPTGQAIKLYNVDGWYRSIRFDFACNSNVLTIRE